MFAHSSSENVADERVLASLGEPSPCHLPLLYPAQGRVLPRCSQATFRLHTSSSTVQRSVVRPKETDGFSTPPRMSGHLSCPKCCNCSRQTLLRNAISFRLYSSFSLHTPLEDLAQIVCGSFQAKAAVGSVTCASCSFCYTGREPVASAVIAGIAVLRYRTCDMLLLHPVPCA